MGRPGITYDHVAAVADALIAETGSATLKAVRERLGTGGMGTIHKHLSTWLKNRPQAPAAPVELPADLARSLSVWVTQAATVARADAEERLQQAQADALDMARAGEQLEAERDDLVQQLAALTTERDKAQATAAERDAEIARLAQDVERERALAGAAQVDAAQARLKAEAQTEQLADLKAEVGRLNAVLATEVQRRSEAEKQAAVMQAECAAARKDAGDERERIKGLQAHLDKAHADMEALRAALAKTEAAERAAAVENAALKAQLAAAEQAIARLQTTPAKS